MAAAPTEARESGPLFRFAKAHVAKGGDSQFSDEDESLLQALARVRVNPQSWGAAFWTPLHMWSILRFPMYPTEAQRRHAAATLHEAWPHILPCGKCSQHLAVNTQDAYDHTQTGLHFFRYLVDLHNWVNVHEKKIRPLTYEQAAAAFADTQGIAEALRGATRGTPRFALGEQEGVPLLPVLIAVVLVVVAVALYVFRARILASLARLRGGREHGARRRRRDWLHNNNVG